MPKPQIQTSIHGRRLGLGPKSELIFNDADGNMVNGRLTPRKVVRRVLTTAEILALNATPIDLTPRPTNDQVNIPYRLQAYKPAGTGYTAGAGEDLAIIHEIIETPLLAIDSDVLLTNNNEKFAIAHYATSNPETYNWNNAYGLALQVQILVGEVTGGVGEVIIDLEYETLDFKLTV